MPDAGIDGYLLRLVSGRLLESQGVSNVSKLYLASYILSSTDVAKPLVFTWDAYLNVFICGRVVCNF